MELNENWLSRILEQLREARPGHAAKVLRLLPLDRPDYLTEAEIFLSKWYNRKGAWSPQQAVQAYVELLDEMSRLQAEYIRTGRYPNSSFSEVEAGFYRQDTRMRAHLEALALAQFLWIDQWERFAFFSEWISQGPGPSHLEIGPGHGLYLLKTLRSSNRDKRRITALDVSPSSLESARAIAGEAIHYYAADFLKWETPEPYDTLTMGEVLEHVEHPDQFLGKARACLKDTGRMFLSTPLHAPMPDHITPFHDPQEVRTLVHQAGFRVHREHICATDRISLELAQRFKKPIMYCAILDPA